MTIKIDRMHSNIRFSTTEQNDLEKANSILGRIIKNIGDQPSQNLSKIFSGTCSFRKLCDIIYENNLLIKPKMFHHIIRCCHSVAAIRLFFDKVPRNSDLTNIYFYNSFISKGRDKNLFLLAKDAFEEAKREKLADVVTFNSFIDAAGKTGPFADANPTSVIAFGNQIP